MSFRLRPFLDVVARLRHNGGTAAVEFGLIGPLFLAMTLAFFDAGLMLAKSMMLDRSLDKTIRLMRTEGSVRPKTLDEFKTKICDQMIIFKQDCQSNLVVEMTVVKSPSGFPTAVTPCMSKLVPRPTAAYASGGRSDPVFVRTCLSTAPLVPLVAEGIGFTRNDLGRFDVISVSGFVNEPGAGDGR